MNLQDDAELRSPQSSTAAALYRRRTVGKAVAGALSFGAAAGKMLELFPPLSRPRTLDPASTGEAAPAAAPASRVEALLVLATVVSATAAYMILLLRLDAKNNRAVWGG